MKHLRKHITFFIAIIMLLQSALVANAEVFSNEIIFEKELIKTSGITMSTSDFSNAFTGEVSNRQHYSLARTMNKSEISISNVAIKGNDISFDASLSLDTNNVDLSVNGKMYAGNKSQSGTNSIIVDIPDIIDGYEFLLFDIHNDNSGGSLILSEIDGKNLSNTPHVKIYLRDSQDMVYLFETELPKAFLTLKADSFPLINGGKDINWALDFVKVNCEILPPTAENLEKLGLSGNSSMRNETYSHYFDVYRYYYTVAGDNVETWSMPWVQYVPTNVFSGDSTWSSEFRISESTRVLGSNGQVINVFYGLQNITYRNVKMQFAAGGNTRFLRTFYDGQVATLMGINATSGIALRVLETTVSNIPGIPGLALQTILNYFSNATPRSETVSLGGQGEISHELKTVSAGQTLTNHMLFANSDIQFSGSNRHYFVMQAVTQREGTVSGSNTTIGALRVQFDVYMQNGIGPGNVVLVASPQKDFTFNYTVN